MRRSYVKNAKRSQSLRSFGPRRGTVSVAVAGGSHLRPDEMARWVFSESEAVEIERRRRERDTGKGPVRYDTSRHLSPMTVKFGNPLLALPRQELARRLARGRLHDRGQLLGMTGFDIT